MGFIGAGGFISAHHLLTVRDSEIMEIRAIADIDEKRLTKHAAGMSVGYTTTDYRKLLADSEIDMVIIGTKQDLHARFIVESLDAGKWVLHISTDFVFDGAGERPYRESDEPDPINKYGASKLAGERLLVESHCRYCIMRVEWTYGLGGNNFVAKLVSLARQGKKLKVVDDQVGSPTATTEAAEAICELLRRRPQGLFHFASSGYTNRYEMAKFIFDKLKIKVDLSSCKTSDYACAAERPLNSCFDCGKIAGVLGKPIENWKIVLERFLEKL